MSIELCFISFWKSCIPSQNNIKVSSSINRADSRLPSSQWQTLLQSNGVSHGLGANLGQPCINDTNPCGDMAWVMLSLSAHCFNFSLISITKNMYLSFTGWIISLYTNTLQSLGFSRLPRFWHQTDQTQYNELHVGVQSIYAHGLTHSIDVTWALMRLKYSPIRLLV